MSKLLYVGQQTADLLSDNIEEHLNRYLESGFEDLESSGDWRIPLSIEADLKPLEELIPDKGPDAEVKNSMLVGLTLASLTPSLARENRIWIRLSHIEGIAYARERWLRNVPQERMAQAVRTHFFASTWTQCRDDHAISRLWWNHHIAAAIQPDDPEQALRLILSRADIRSNLVERARVGTRLPLAKAIVKRLERDAQLAASESAFRNFMKALNIRAAGAQLEMWDEERMDRFIEQCAE
ncbi:DUF6339 family protein [Pseudofulvimonas gallinarii]|uniref:Uncharacterized protein n=1 Tax=Pseudofulvimonas gallinarii TaxID=634155 RepID=A0A4R3LCI3_9GAMM|nr:DUF6339 family protein [Pseudofulvimonas gallinarii]TCS97589.1 hypothetical protein EDC25_11271 [Pseudofulvimonas gallinarii]THD13433.1 hypothetical protein B1808_07890 [Pseudofulvimonas gallinarii]